ncbi:hypothetical protein PTKIN_Ptkin12aG0217300 [Pterospermum kingtungense]
MEAVHDYGPSWSSSTNWSVAHGSLLDSVTFESSFAPITDSNPDERAVDDLNAVDSAPKFPLILCPTSPDSAPCEITIAFAQKHEVRQVYVRSTARVYEIYYATKPQSSNEYLYTVRCGIASRDEEVLRAADLDEAALPHLNGASKELNEKRLRNDSNSNSTEDDWVDVKAPDTPSLDCGSTVPSNFRVNPGSTQDLYEATAEITDADPCMSITLRLLSLQNKGCICVDELYVFADPVESADSEDAVSQMGNAGGSSLMAMLAPTLLQLSKTAGLGRIQNEAVLSTNKTEKTQENVSKDIEPLKFGVEQEGKPILANSQEVDSQEAVASTFEPNRHEIPPLKNSASKADVSCGHIERFLDQLVSRVSRVEDLLLKFEENMLKPISSIDARLQMVERQLEELTKKPKNSELSSCTRYFAPEFSSHDSDNYTPYNIGNESSCHDLCASHEKDISSSIQPDETVYPVNATQSFPSLVVTAPEFSNGDDEEDDHASGTDSPKDKPKQNVSIDEALASALASFLSSASIEPLKCNQTLAVKAPEFLHEEDGNIDKKVSPESHFGVTSEPCSLDTRDGMDSTTVSVSSDSPVERIVEATCCLNEDYFARTAKVAVEDCQGQGTCHDTVDCTITPATHDLHHIAEDLENGDLSNETGKILVLDEADILNQFLENQVDDVSATVEEGAPGNMEIKAEVSKQGSHDEFLWNVLELSYASSVVDFETPILDVKFTSQDNSKNKSPLEALLSGMPITDTVASCSKKSDDEFQASEECNLISLGEGEATWPATIGHFSEDVDGYSLSCVPLKLEVENLEDNDACSNKELPAGSLI